MGDDEIDKWVEEASKKEANTLKLFLTPMDIDAKLKIIGNYHGKLLERYHALGTTIAQLTAKGCVDAKEHWKDGKYLYLLYKMKDGVRKKKYVSNHPLRVAEARQKLQNYKDRWHAS